MSKELPEPIKSVTCRYRGTAFLVEIKRVETIGVLVERHLLAQYKWFIYVYLFEKHPFFEAFNKLNTLSECYDESLPQLGMHGGITLFSRNTDNGSPSIKLGCDYCHYDDDAFNIEHSSSVLADARDIYIYYNLDCK